MAAERLSQNAMGERENNFQVHAPQVNLPKGGGAVRGIGEKFSANPVAGMGSMTVPIAASPGRSGFHSHMSPKRIFFSKTGPSDSPVF